MERSPDSRGGWLRAPGLRTVAAAVLFCGGVSVATTAPTRVATVERWEQDLDYLVETLESVHPDLYGRVGREAFARCVRQLRAALPELEDDQIVVRLMQLVAEVGDGHTSLDPVDPAGFGRWYPVRFYRFTDGIFITAAARELAPYVGARVERIGELQATEAWERAATLLGADNEFGALERAPYYLANAVALRALGVAAEADRLRLELRLADGRVETVQVPAIEEEFSLDFQFWGEIWGPGSSKVDYATAFAPSSDDHYDEASDLPLHLRYRSTFWSTYLEETGLFYVQINAMGDSRRRGQSFAEFTAETFRAADAAEVDLFVLDLRYNFGGDGSLVRDFVHELIRRPPLSRKGTLFVIVGRQTFSAGVMFARALEEHTEATFVGEPMGAYWLHYGDGTVFSLPNSGLQVWVSTVLHQLSSYAGERTTMPNELPARFSSTDYFGGRDPALEQIVASRDRPSIATLFHQKGAAAALATYEERRVEYGGVDWWEPFSLRELGDVGHDLGDEERWQDALAAHRLNVRRHPDHWRVWWNLGRALQATGDLAGAVESYERALAVDPFNNLASLQRARLAELRPEGESAD